MGPFCTTRGDRGRRLSGSWGRRAQHGRAPRVWATKRLDAVFIGIGNHAPGCLISSGKAIVVADRDDDMDDVAPEKQELLEVLLPKLWRPCGAGDLALQLVIMVTTMVNSITLRAWKNGMRTLQVNWQGMAACRPAV